MIKYEKGKGNRMKTIGKRKSGSVWIVIISLFVCLSMLSSCAAGSAGGSSDSYYADDMSVERDMQYASDGGVNSVQYLSEAEEQSPNAQDEAEFGIKIIYTTTLSIETLDFDESYSMIMQSLKEYGGYVSHSSQYGGASANGTYSNRTADMTLRIPAEHYNAFLDGTVEFGNTVRRIDYTEDITSSYLDTESKIESLKVQEQRLLELLEMAENLDDLLKIEQELANVRYQLDSYTRQLQFFENQVQYSTITISLREVGNYSTDGTDGFFAQVWDAIKGSVVFFLNFLRVLVIVAIYLLPFAVIALAVYYIFRPFWKKQAQKRAEKRRLKQAAYAARSLPMGMIPPAQSVQPVDKENGK